MNINGERIKAIVITKDGNKVAYIVDEGLVVNVVTEKGYDIELIPEEKFK
jgi:hypothetical protein